MAVYTSVSLAEAKDFLAPYNLGAITEVESIAEGVENSNFRIHADSGRYILTLFERRVREADLPYYLNLMNHLSAKGLRCPSVYDPGSGPLGRLNGRPACLIEHLDGDTVKAPTADLAAEAGRLMARMHQSGSDFRSMRANDLGLKGWHGLAAEIGDRADEVSDGLAQLIDDELSFLDQHWPKDLPEGPIHGDLFPDNLMVDADGKTTGVIDFYFAAQDAFAYDIAVVINAWAFSKDGLGYDPRITKAFLENYDMVRPITAAETAALPVLCRGASLRFLLTRLYDWLNQVDGAVVTPKDPRDYRTRLAFHQRIRDAADYVL